MKTIVVIKKYHAFLLPPTELESRINGKVVGSRIVPGKKIEYPEGAEYQFSSKKAAKEFIKAVGTDVAEIKSS